MVVAIRIIITIFLRKHKTPRELALNVHYPKQLAEASEPTTNIKEAKAGASRHNNKRERNWFVVCRLHTHKLADCLLRRHINTRG